MISLWVHSRQSWFFRQTSRWIHVHLLLTTVLWLHVDDWCWLSTARSEFRL
jgi:hypothetical protein